jgi:hypothetical protein
MEETNFQLHSESINEIAKALCEASKKIQPAIKAVENTFFKKNYADLKAIDHACRIPLTENGLCISQLMDSTNGQLTLITILMHSSGQWLKSYYPITYDKTTPQAIGSGVAYARRYSYAAIINVVTEDDDGEAATKRETDSKTYIEKKVAPLPVPIPNKEQVILKGTYYPEKPKKQTEKEAMVEKMKSAKTLNELRHLFTQCSNEWKNEDFYLFAMKLEARFEEDFKIYIDKLTAAKDLIELQSLIAEVKTEWNTEQFKAYVKTLEHKLRAGFESEMKDMFDAEEVKPETVQKKGVKK